MEKPHEEDKKSLVEQMEMQNTALRLALTATGVGIWQWFLDKDEIYWDEHCWSLLGRTPSKEPLNYQQWRNWIHPDDHRRLKRDILKQLKAGNQYVIEFRYLCADGQWLWVEGRGQSVENDAQGKPVRIVGTHTNIQERKTLELQRDTTLNTLNSMLQGLPDLVFRFNSEGRLLSVKDDPNLIQPASRIQGQLITEVLKPELAELTLEKIAATLQNQRPETYEYSLFVDGQKHYYEARMVPLAQDEVLALTRDITEQTVTRHQLLASQKRFKAVFDIAPMGITLTDEQGHIIDCNPESERLLGISKAEHLNRDYDGIDWTIYAENGEFLEAKDYASVRALEDNRPVIGQVQNIRNENFSSWILVSALPLNLPGYGVLIAYVDINNLKQAEIQLAEQSKELRRSNAELEHFAYVASHDLRQPLRMISSFIKLLKNRLPEELGEEEQKMMGFVMDGAQRMDQMLVSLLEYSRVGRKGEPQQWLNSQEPLKEALQFLRPLIEESQASIDLAEQEWPEIHASPDEMTRLFQNLISNALKYRQPGKPPAIKLSCQRKEAFWQFCISDEGIGIETHQFDRLFKVFQRLHTSEEYEGSGIGLAICRKIVERQGGSIWVESEGKNQGSRFIFTLPVQEAE